MTPFLVFCFLIFAFPSAIIAHNAQVISPSNPKTKGFSLDVSHYRSKFSLFNRNNFYSNPELQSRTIADGLGDYVIELYVGNPPVKMYAMADTGSGLVWFQCTTCEQNKCYKQNVPMLNPLQSSTYGFVTCYDPICKSLGYSSCGYFSQVPPCMYNYSYAEGTTFEGVLAVDNIGFSQELEFPYFVFGCSQNYFGDGLTDYAAGIIGLNMGPSSLVTQLGIKKFSYCLTHPNSNVTGKITFGDDYFSGYYGSESDAGTVSTPLIKRNNSEEYWDLYWVNLEGASVDGKMIKIQNNSTEGNIILDSGTTETWLDEEFYHKLESAVKNAIDLTPVKDKRIRWHSLCYKDIPEIEVVFHFTGANVTLKSENLFRPIHEYSCFNMQPQDSLGGVPFIYGNVAQTNFKVTHDIANEVISFTPAPNCAQV